MCLKWQPLFEVVQRQNIASYLKNNFYLKTNRNKNKILNHIIAPITNKIKTLVRLFKRLTRFLFILITLFVSYVVNASIIKLKNPILDEKKIQKNNKINNDINCINKIIEYNKYR